MSTPSDHRFLEGPFAPVTDPVARVHLPARIPLGFHGSWLPDR